MILEDDAPPEFFADTRRKLVSTEDFVVLLRWKEEFEAKCPEITLYSPDQFATHWVVNQSASKEIKRKCLLVGSSFLGVAFLLFAIATGLQLTLLMEIIFYLGAVISLALGAREFLGWSQLDVNKEKFFEQVKANALLKAELDKRLGASIPKDKLGYPPNTGIFDVPPQS